MIALTHRQREIWWEVHVEVTNYRVGGKCYSLGEAMERSLRYLNTPSEKMIPSCTIFEVEGNRGSASLTALLVMEDKDG